MALLQPTFIYCVQNTRTFCFDSVLQRVAYTKRAATIIGIFPRIIKLFCFAVSKAEILSGPELFVRAGSDINLTCVAKHAPDPPR